MQTCASSVEFGRKPAMLLILENAEDRIANESEALRASVLDSLPQNLYCKDGEGRYTFANKAFQAWVGKSLPEIVGRTDYDFFPGDTARRFAAIDKGIVQSQGIADFVEGWLSPEGETTFSEMKRSAKYGPDGNVSGVVAVFWDITARKTAEEELQRERGFFDTLMDVIPDTIYFKDSDTRFTKINLAQARVLGLTHPREAIGKSDADFFNLEHAKRARADDIKVMKAGKPLLDLVEKNTVGDGEARWFSSTKVPILDKDGHAIGMVGISRNITERKVAEEALERSMEAFLNVVSAVSDGDLTLRGGEGDDTLGKISHAVNRMLESFSTMLARVKLVCFSVSSSATQILAASQEIATAAGRQADEVTNASSTVEEMAAAMAQVSRNAEASAEAARQALN
ncbi:MAG: methyl-accepting chemotaxis protein, partial [Blastocatellia bacterium]